MKSGAGAVKYNLELRCTAGARKDTYPFKETHKIWVIIQVWAKASKQKKPHKYSKPALEDLIVQMVKSLITQENCEQNKCQPKNSKKHINLHLVITTPS